MWKKNTFVKVDLNSSSLKELINVLKSLCEQDNVIVSCFEVRNPNVFNEVPQEKGKLEEFIKKFLLSPDIIHLMPELNIKNSLKENIYVKYLSSLIFDGDLAIRILLGGAYKEFNGNPSDAKKIGQKLSNEIIGDRYTDITIFTTDDAFTDWYFGVAWDTTWIIFDKGKSKVWIICMTDTD